MSKKFLDVIFGRSDGIPDATSLSTVLFVSPYFVLFLVCLFFNDIVSDIAIGWREIYLGKTSLCQQMLPLQSLCQRRGLSGGL